jgi:hypothetical protein
MKKSKKQKLNKTQKSKLVRKIIKLEKKLGKVKNSRIPGAFAPVTKVVYKDTKKVRFEHTEYISTIIPTSSAESIVATYSINPGLTQTFPWASNLGCAFEQYRLFKFEVHFETNLATDNSGTIAIIPDYDSADNNTGMSYQQLMAHEDSVTGPIYRKLTMRCSKRNLPKKKLFCRTGALSPNLDVKTYDALQVHIVTIGSTATLGRIFFKYDIEFYKPQLSNSPLESSIIVNTDPKSATEPFYTSYSVPATITGGISAVVQAADQINLFEKGKFFVRAVANGVSLTDVADIVLVGKKGDFYLHEKASNTTDGIVSLLFETMDNISSTNPLQIHWDGATGTVGDTNFFLTRVENTMFSAMKELMKTKKKTVSKQKIKKMVVDIKKQNDKDQREKMLTTLLALMNDDKGKPQ